MRRRARSTLLARRISVLALAAAVATAGLLPATTTAAHAATIAGVTGDGSPEAPFVLDSAADLDAVTAAINTDASTYGALAYELGADIDYGGAAFAGITAFSGFFDGAGHAISDLDYADEANTVAFFRTLEGATVTDLTLVGVSAATLDGSGRAAGIAAVANSSTVTGNSVIDSSLTITPAGSTNNTQAAGLVGYATGSTTVTDNLVWDTTVTGRKYAAGLVAYPVAGTVVARNLTVDVDVVGESPGGASIAAAIVAQLQTTSPGGGVDVSGNVVVRGSATGERARTYAAGPAGMSGSAPNLVDTTTVFDTTADLYAGDLGTPTAPEELTLTATYEGLGWDLAAGSGAWRRVEGLGHPVPTSADVPSYSLSYDLAGGTASGNPASYLFGSETMLAHPTRAGHEFAGWTGTDLDSPTLDVTVPRGATGDRTYVATWATSTTYAVTYDLAGGEVEGNPSTYTVESPSFTLRNPTRAGFEFAGWTGTDLSGPTGTVTVAAGSTGERSFTATWSEAALELPGLTGSGAATDPFVLDTAADLDTAATAINTDTATYGTLSYRLGADIDYAGETFTGITTFSGVLDGAGHAIRDVVYANAANSSAFFRALTGATVKDLTLVEVAATTQDGFGSAAAIAVSATDATLTGNTVVDSTVSIAKVGTNVNTQAAGLVAGSFGTTTISDNVVWDVDVIGRKYAAAVVAYPRAGTVVTRNLVVDADVVADTGGGGSTAGLLIAQTQATPGIDVAANVVVRGSATGAARTLGVGPVATTSTADNLVSSATTVGEGTVPGNPGTTATPEQLADRATYAGLGWDLTDGGAWRWNDALGHPVPVAAALPTYALAYDLAGGTATGNPGSYVLGSPAVVVAAPTRPGYQFAGWTGPGVSGAALSLTIAAGATADRAYVATWTPTAYAVSYDLAGGTAGAGDPTSYDVESVTFTLAPPTRKGYTFAGWTGTGLTTPTTTVVVPAGSIGDRAYTATWSAPIGYTLTYDLAGGVPAGPNLARYDVETATFTLTNPTRSGYTFAGWTGSGLGAPTETVAVPVGSTGDRSYVATWTADVYAVAYDVAGGTLVDGNRARYTVATPDFALVNPTRKGYTFTGWTGTGLTAPATTVVVAAGSTGNRSYAATWSPLAYPLTYDLAGGTAPGAYPTSYDVESPTIVLGAPSRRGHTFAGWVGTGLAAPSTSLSIPTGSMGARTYVATWTALAPARAETTLRLRVVAKADGRRLARPRKAVVALSSGGTVVLTATSRVRGKKITRTRTVVVGTSRTTVRLPGRMKPGRWKVRARYAGDSGHLPATSRTVTVRVR